MAQTDSTENGLPWQQGINFSGQEIIGDREGQEDYSLFRVLKGGKELLVVLSDGMGGHTSGEVASRNSVTVFDKTFNEYPSDSVPGQLGAALQQANNDLGRLIQKNSSLDGMGCTLIGAHIGSNGLQWISVGDSLLYIFRNGTLDRLNADHSMTPVIEESLKSGKISQEEARNHPSRNALRSAVMGGELPLIDISKSALPLQSGDIIIVASDGLLTLTSAEITQTLKKNNRASAQHLSKLLIEAVSLKRKPRQDNTTIQIICIPSTYATSSSALKKIAMIAGTTLAIGALAIASYFIFNTWISGKSTADIQRASPTPTPIPNVAADNIKEQVLQPQVSAGNESAPAANSSSGNTKKTPADKSDAGKGKGHGNKAEVGKDKKIDGLQKGASSISIDSGKPVVTQGLESIVTPAPAAVVAPVATPVTTEVVDVKPPGSGSTKSSETGK